jgi:hypothetical protein
LLGLLALNDGDTVDIVRCETRKKPDAFLNIPQVFLGFIRLWPTLEIKEEKMLENIKQTGHHKHRS